jgi:glycerol-3-phosphate dehydrogenase
MTQHDRIMIYGPKADGACVVEFGRWNCNTLEWVHEDQDEELRMQRQVKAKSLSVKIPKNEPTTVRLNCVLANEEFLTLEIPRYALERFMVQAKRAIEEAPLLSRRRSGG